MRKLLVVVSLLSVASTTACTRYGWRSTYGQHQEVGRRMVGSPQVETITSANVNAGYVGVSARVGYGGTVGVGAVVGGYENVQRTHCVQQAQIDYAQAIESFPIIEHRSHDVIGAVGLGLLGLLTYGGARQSYNFDVDEYYSDLEFHQIDPSFFPRPTYPDEPTNAYYAGAGIALAGAAWLVYSLVALPHGAPPAPTRQERRWTETTVVEATGCGLVPEEQGIEGGATQPDYPPPPSY